MTINQSGSMLGQCNTGEGRFDSTSRPNLGGGVSRMSGLTRRQSLGYK